ncbi:MAG: sigma-70 family RNA polymerase sigma factor [Opitutaceae bacterium]
MTEGAGNASFATTRWTLVFAAAGADSATRSSDSISCKDRSGALADLCRAYWPPLYAHARRRRLPPADAEDAVQGFFARLLRLESLSGVDRERGRFRAFLLGSFNHYLADLRDSVNAEKRGAHLLTPLGTDTAEMDFARAATSELPPDRAFDRAWALALLSQVAARLRAEHLVADRLALFEKLSPCLAGRRADAPHAALAAELGMSEPAVRVALHRLRQRYRQLLREEIALTVAADEDVDDELRLLLRALGG